MMLNNDQMREINRMGMRLAYDYAIAGYSGDERGETLASVKFISMIKTLRAIGIEYEPLDIDGCRISAGNNGVRGNLFTVGANLRAKGYKREGDRLVRKVTDVEGAI